MNRLVVALLLMIFAAVFVGLTWAAVLVFHGPLVLAWVVSAVVVIGLAAWGLWRWWRGRRLSGRLASAVASEADDAGLRPEVRAQIAETRAELERALRTLRSSKLGGQGGGALAALPWYVMIGPPGAGKSTLLRNSGLKFPYLNSRRGAVRGVGGTRNCDWWLANEGILLDTAGRWSVEDDDQEEWLAFLDLLRRTRRGTPLNGVIVSISAADLLEPGTEGVSVLAKKLRERVDEVIGRLEVTLPVYLIVTKCDLVGGFSETFASLDERSREQIWGLTLPLDSAAGDLPELFAERLDRLVDALEGQALQRLAGEHRPEVSRRLYEFPQQFEELCPGLIELVNDLFAPNSYQDTPVLRGVYFTSATQGEGAPAGEGAQSGRPIERVRARLAEQLGISPPAEEQLKAKARSYFLGDVFRRVIFPDRNVAGEGDRAVRRHRLAGWAAGAGLFAAAGGVALVPVNAYQNNLAFAGLVERHALGLLSSRGPRGGELQAGVLERLLEPSSELLRQRREGPSFDMRYGYYQGDVLDPVVGQVARAHVVAPLLARDVGLLAAAKVDDQTLSALRLHLLLTAAKGNDEPRAANMRAEARALAVARWRAHVGPAVTSPRGEQVIGDAVELYLRAAEEWPTLWEPRHADAVAGWRAKLCAGAARDPLGQILSGDDLGPEVSLGGTIGGSITLFEGNPRVGGAFTREGARRMRLRLAERRWAGGSDDAWVLGGCEGLTPAQRAALVREYLRRYEEAWRAFIAAVAPVAKSELPQASLALRRYVDERPLVTLWQALAEHLRPEPKAAPTPSLLGAAGAKLEAAAVNAAAAELDLDPSERRTLARRFEPLVAFGITGKEGVPSMLDAYHDQLRGVVAALEAFADNRDAGALRAAVSRARRDIEDLVIRGRAPAWEPVLRRLLLAPLAGLEGAAVAAGAEATNRRWCDGVVAEFDRGLAGRYPFRAEGADAPLAQVEKFFHPQTGVLWQFVRETLASELEPQSFRPRAGTSLAYRAELGSYLRRAQAATELLFHRGAQQLTVPIEARIWPGGSHVAQTSLRVGNERILHRNDGERFQPLVWPARDAVLSLKGPPDQDVVGLGDWGLFRLLDRAQTRPYRAREEFLRATFVEVLPGVSVAVDFKPANLVSVLRGLQPPRAIVAGRSVCGTRRDDVQVRRTAESRLDDRGDEPGREFGEVRGARTTNGQDPDARLLQDDDQRGPT